MAACIDLLSFIFTSVTDMPEYHRQVVVPNVPKFSIALVAIISKEDNHELMVSCPSPFEGIN